MSSDSYHQSIVEEIYKSPWAADNPILQKIKGKTQTHTTYETNSSNAVIVRGFWIKNPFDETPPEDYYVFQHDMSVDRGSEMTYWNPSIGLENADCILAERHQPYKGFSIWANQYWLRVLSLSIGIIDAERISEIQRIVLSHLKTNKNGITTEENLKPTGKEYTRISHVVHILEESFSQPTKAPSSISKSEIEEPQNSQVEQPTISISTAVSQPQSPTQQIVPPKRFWQRRLFWPTVGVACLVGGIFAYRSSIQNFLNQLRSHKS